MTKINSTPAQAAQAECVRNARTFIGAAVIQAEAAQACDLAFRTYALSVAVAVSKGAKPSGIAAATKDGLADLADVAPKGTVYTTATAVGHVMRTGRVLALPVGVSAILADSATEAEAEEALTEAAQSLNGRAVLSLVRRASQGEGDGGIGTSALDGLIRRAKTQAEAVKAVKEALKEAHEALANAEAEAAEAMAEALENAQAEGMSLATLLNRAADMVTAGAEIDAEASEALATLYTLMQAEV